MKKIYINIARYPLHITGEKKKPIIDRNMLCNL